MGLKCSVRLCLLLWSAGIAYNGQGLLLCWYFITFSPELKPNGITGDEDKNKKLNRITSAGIAADNEQKDEDLFVTGKKRKLPHENYRLNFLKIICPQENNAESK